jgi:hypothetical protein
MHTIALLCLCAAAWKFQISLESFLLQLQPVHCTVYSTNEKELPKSLKKVLSSSAQIPAQFKLLLNYRFKVLAQNSGIVS